MSDFQKFLDQALDKVDLPTVEDSSEVEAYDIDAEVRDLVVDARNASNLTQKQLAQRSGVSQANISKIENGKADFKFIPMNGDTIYIDKRNSAIIILGHPASFINLFILFISCLLLNSNHHFTKL